MLKNRKTFQRVLKMLDAGEMPPEAKPQPPAAELEAFKTAVARTLDAADRNGKPDPGRVTIRRLNRAEYNNTIRDLVGVDFKPAEDFPSDDVGYGFDNIGDVLSLSPVLMERYLAAAESDRAAGDRRRTRRSRRSAGPAASSWNRRPTRRRSASSGRSPRAT